MSRAPGQRSAAAGGGGGLGPRHRATTGRRRRPIRPREQDLEEMLQDARVRGGWLGHGAAGSRFTGDMEGCVHGGYPSRYFAAGDSSLLPPTMAEHAREEASRLRREMDRIERSIAVPICLSSDADHAGVFSPDGGARRRLGRYLDAARRLRRLDASGDLDRRKKALLRTAMSSLAVELCRVPVWELAAGARRDCSPASIWESARRRSRSRSGGRSDDSPASWPSSSSGSSLMDKSDDSSSHNTSLGEEPSLPSFSAFSGMIYVDRRAVSIVDDVAREMSRCGYEHMLRGAFVRHGLQLARYMEILDIDNILGGHMEEPREILIKVWTSAMRISIALLSEMQRQLNVQDIGSFNTLKEEYFCAIAKASIMKLLKSVSSICIHVAPSSDSSQDSYAAVRSDLSKIENVVMMYQALNDGMPRILTLFLGRTKEFIISEGDWLMNKLSGMFIKLSSELNNLVRLQRLFITNTGVHRFTKNIMHHMRLLVQQKNTILLMLKGDFNVFGEQVTRLISSLDFMLDMNSRSLRLQGQQQIFCLNNVQFMFQEAKKNTDLGLILGESWLLRWHEQQHQWIAGYVDASWTPVMSSLERRTRFPTILWPHQLVDKFTSSFEMTYNMQKNWKVTDPLMRRMLREAISEKVIPLYQIHMENYSEQHKSVRYGIEQVKSQLLEMFEG
ncbi:hypothetical protein ACP4OV_030722 [Aristida adscensionis]